MREHRRGIPLTRACHEFLCAADLPIAATNGMRRAIGVVASGARRERFGRGGAAGAALRCRPGDGVVRSRCAHRACRLAAGRCRGSGSHSPTRRPWPRRARASTSCSAPVKIGANGVDLHYGRRLESLLERFGTSRASVLPNTVRYSAQLVEWRECGPARCRCRGARPGNWGSATRSISGPRSERMAAAAPARERVRAELPAVPLHASVAFLSCQPQSAGPAARLGCRAAPGAGIADVARGAAWPRRRGGMDPGTDPRRHRDRACPCGRLVAAAHGTRAGRGDRGGARRYRRGDAAGRRRGRRVVRRAAPGRCAGGGGAAGVLADRHFRGGQDHHRDALRAAGARAALAGHGARRRRATRRPQRRSRLQRRRSRRERPAHRRGSRR